MSIVEGVRKSLHLAWALVLLSIVAVADFPELTAHIHKTNLHPLLLAGFLLVLIIATAMVELLWFYLLAKRHAPRAAHSDPEWFSAGSKIDYYRQPVFKAEVFWVAVLVFLFALGGLRALRTEMQKHAEGFDLVYLLPAAAITYSFVHLVIQQTRMRRLVRRSEPTQEQQELLSIVGIYPIEMFYFMAGAIWALAGGISLLLALPRH